MAESNSQSEFIRRLPKAELHLHLEGTVTPETLVELSRRHDSVTLTLDKSFSIYDYKNFSEFLMAFKAVTERLRTPEDYELIAWRMFERLAAQGIVHAEIYVAVGVVYYWSKVEFEPLFAGLESARIRAEQKLGITAYWIFDAVRHFGVEAAGRVFRKAAEMRSEHPSIVGIGFGGDERQTGPEVFRDLYSEARDAGLRLTAHAGESAGPESIWGAINIGAERIGHGLTAIEDPELMLILAERQIPIEVCITSNIRTGCCHPLTSHPVRSYFDAGLMITLNSDDPAMFGSDLEGEYALARNQFGFTNEHLRELAANSIEASFMPAERKVDLLRKIESLS